VLNTVGADALAELSTLNRGASSPRAVERGGSGILGRRGWLAAVLLLAIVSLAPLLVVDVPAVLDYPNHLARYFILANPGDPILSRMYAARWAVLPNLGMDVLGAALLAMTPAHVGGRILLGLSLISPMVGAIIYARAAFGRWTWWSLGAGVIAFNGMFFLGFMNFLLALGVALAGAGAWRLCRRAERPVLAVAVGALASLIAFFCHLLGFAYFGLLIAADEAETLLALRRAGQPVGRRAVSSATALSAALGPTLVLYGLIRRSTARGDWLAWNWRAKLLQWQTPFMTYDRAVTICTAAVVGAVVILAWRRSRMAGGVAVALAALVGLYVLAPCSAAGGTFVDARLPLMAALLLFAGLSPQLSRRAAIGAAAAFAVLIAGRAMHVTLNWQGRAHDLAELRASLAHVEPGAKILPARTDYPADPPSGRGLVLPNVAPLDEHLGALAVLERRAFWPLLFADPAQQPLAVRPPYDQLAAPLGPLIPWRTLYQSAPSTGELALYPYLADWRGRYDYVLVVGPRPPPGAPPRGLTLLRAGEGASLYRIDHTLTREAGRARPSRL
jgi:hypothetical protein